jgi:hypothetical protein
LEDTALANLSQIQFGKVAIEKAVDPQVRAFAGRNLSDYSRIRDALSSVAAADQAPLPDHLSGEALRDYLKAFWNVINWDFVSERYAAAVKA